MSETKTITIGSKAPDFTLKNQFGEEFTLSQQKGRKILLSFHPLAWTGVCAEQMNDLERLRDEFDKLNTTAVGISVDSVPSKKAWADSLGITYLDMLADFWPHGEVATKYGIFRKKDGFSERTNIIVDENQTIVFIRVYEISEKPDFDELLSFLKEQTK